MASKNKFQIEFTLRSSVKILYNQLSSPSGLSEWFADNVNFRGKNYTFFWDGDEQEAEMVNKKMNQHIKFRWLEEPEDTYFEFRIQVDEITRDVSLIITDFAEDQEDEEEAKLLWEKQVEKLCQSIGS